MSKLQNNNDETKTKNVRKGKSGRGRKPNKRGSRPNNYNNDKVSTPKDDINDSSFYYTDPMLRDQLNNYSLTGFLGLDSKVGDRFINDAWQKMYFGIPSMMSVYLNPSLETNLLARLENRDLRSSGIYRVGLKNYYLLSANNAKTTNYQPSDVSLLIVLLGQLASTVGFCRRAFGSMAKYNQRNRDLPRELITGSCINYDDFKNNLANYRTRYNVILNTLNKLPIPGNIAYITKWGSMFSNYYIDEFDNPLAQWYIPIPYSTWKLNETKSDRGPGADTIVLCAEMHNFSFYLDTLEQMIDAIMTSSTFNYIFADILRLADKSGLPLLTFNSIPDNEDAPVLFSEEFNLWIDNAEILGIPKDTPIYTNLYTTSNDILTDVENNSISYNPAFNRPNIAPQYLINFKKANPDVEQRVAAIRLKKITSWYTNQEDKSEVGFYGPDAYCVGLGILGTNPYNNQREFFKHFSPNGFLIENLGRQVTYLLAAVTQFNYAPKFIISFSQDTDTNSAMVFGTLDYFTSIDFETMERIWDAEWLGLIEMR